MMMATPMAERGPETGIRVKDEVGVVDGPEVVLFAVRRSPMALGLVCGGLDRLAVARGLAVPLNSIAMPAVAADLGMDKNIDHHQERQDRYENPQPLLGIASLPLQASRPVGDSLSMP